MPTKIFDMSQKQPPPYQAQLLVGGALPYKWDLYDYAPSGADWNVTHLGSAQSAEWLEIPTGGNLDGHTLCWAVVVVTQDDQPLTVDITASLKTAKGVASQSGQRPVSKSDASFFVWVGVKV